MPPDDNGAPKYDQRGHSRINSADIGAYEFEGCIPTEMKSKWNPSSFGQDSWVYDMSVVSDSVVWAKDSNADSISITTNGGASWISKPLPIPNGYLRAAGGICALSATKAYYILSTSDSKGIYVTLDGGDNWTKQSTGFNQSSLFPDIIHFWNDNEGVAIGDASPNFEIYTTSNGGVQWNQVTNANMPNGNSEGTYNNQDAFRIAGNSIFFLTGSARVFKSLDKGKTWSVVNTPFHNAIDSVITFDFKDNSNGLISYCSNDGIHHKMYKTTNGGQTWDSISTNNFYQRIKYIQTANAYFSINIKGGLSYSCDNGNTWTSVTYFDGVKLQTASFSSNDKIFFGSFGTIYWSSPILTISANALSIAPTANSIKTFNILSNTNWKVSCDKTWLKVSSTDGLGNSIITLTATANPASTARTAIVTITGKGLASQTISVTQEVPVLTVSTNTLSIAATANSTKTFDITSNIAWTAASNQSWLTLNNASGSGNATITLTATKNPTVAARAATVTVSGTSVTDQTITVTQDANTTGINEISKNPVSMFPNPVANELTINEISINATILIFDLNGKLLINRIAKSTSEKIDLSSFARGVYLIEVADKKEIKTSKLIKQ